MKYLLEELGGFGIVVSLGYTIGGRVWVEELVLQIRDVVDVLLLVLALQLLS